MHLHFGDHNADSSFVPISLSADTVVIGSDAWCDAGLFPKLTPATSDTVQAPVLEYRLQLPPVLESTDSSCHQCYSTGSSCLQCYRLQLPPVLEYRLQLPPVLEYRLQLPPVLEYRLQLPPVLQYRLQLPPVLQYRLQLPPVLQYRLQSRLELDFSGFSMWWFLKPVVGGLLQILWFPSLLLQLMVSANEIKLK